MSDTLIGTLIGTVGTVAVATITWLATRGKTGADAATTRAQLTEQRRQQDITTIIETLQEEMATQRTEVASLRVAVRAHEETINALRLENYDLRGDKAQLGNRLAEQDRKLVEQDQTIGRLQTRVRELEGRSSC